MLTTEQGTRGPALVGGATGLLVGVVLLNAVLLPGYTWIYDMVFVPDLPWSDRTLGIDGSVPRAVPTDAVVALLDQVLPGDVVQAGLLLAVFVVVGAGCGRLCLTRPGAAAAAVAACWNPYVVERLIIGHWSFLLGYATLPWIHSAGRDLASGHRGAGRRLAGWLALAGLAGSTSAVIAALTAVVAVSWAWGGGTAAVVRRVGLVLGVTAAVAAAWLIPSLTRPGGLPADPAGVEAFAAHADTPWGTWVSLLTSGGIWHSPSWPGSRGSALVTGFALVMVIFVVVTCLRSRYRGRIAPLAVVGAIGLLVAGASALPAGEALVTWLVTNVPGAGLVRDSQKFVAPFALLVAVAAGSVVDLLNRPAAQQSRQARDRRRILAAVVLVAPIVAMPDAPFAAGASMGSVEISQDLLRARDFLEAAPPGDVAVLPWSTYRRFDWNDDRVSLDPWNRLLDRRVIVDDDLPLSRVTVEGEDPAAAAIEAALADPEADLPAALRAQGVRWVVLLRDQPGAAAAEERLGGGSAVRRFGSVLIQDLGPGDTDGVARTSVVPAVITGVAALVALLAWASVGITSRRRS
ncbi:hypothetical protein [Aeromicrobium wangtongii]|uniref:YfhO family protein n=1 Tax=Aeromicrobium wangtongii TaxID=2969247 RepID=A0ABY5MCC0_9ACTN|nr:hypothetical protein [Aeromicrobium wangtongii]MCD9197618.1 hypothetical protein [Aeromicrobium wangtongii]UUP15107.1 hypothetical protein NQV15_07285 [Aeromicrobium wangtongii]